MGSVKVPFAKFKLDPIIAPPLKFEGILKFVEQNRAAPGILKRSFFLLKTILLNYIFQNNLILI
jgi:hypothetical protein